VAKHRRGRYGPRRRGVVAGGLALGVVLGGGLVAAAAIPLAKGPPALALEVPAHDPGATAPLAFPSQGESALAIPTLHVVKASAHQSPVPIASVTKLMNAYVTLAALPITTDQSGPSIVVTSADVAEYRHDVRTGQSCVKVAAGEVLTERQLLDGLLVHSANNFASLLGRLVAGSDGAMVDRMNAAAAALHLTATTYVDVSGLDPSSQSSALDVLHLATDLMRDPTFAAIVRQTSVVLPVAGVVDTFTPYLGKPGVVGIKTGTTSEAGGCDVMAFDASDAGRTVQIIDVVLGQSSTIPGRGLEQAAGRAALVLASSAAHHLGVWRVTTARAPVGTIGWPASGVPVVATSTIELPTFDGEHTSSTAVAGTWGRNQVSAGEPVATVFVTSGAYRQVSQVVAAATLTRPSLWQRLR
jgi:D-alanyl-D-alanine carboxypeptidase (penicillin-binding protein 5/6)